MIIDQTPADTRAARGRTAHLAGLSAEDRVARHYQDRGYGIAGQRWRGAGAEIDLVLRKGTGLVFVEVKKSRSFALAAQRLDKRQMARICLAASAFVANEPAGELTPLRFDVALVDQVGAVEIIENAFGSA